MSREMCLATDSQKKQYVHSAFSASKLRSIAEEVLRAQGTHTSTKREGQSKGIHRNKLKNSNIHDQRL